MNEQSKMNFKIVTLILPVLLTMSMHAAEAGTPRGASATVTRTGPGGNSAVRQSTATTNGLGGYSAHSTLTGSNGKTASRQQSGSYNAATQTYSRSGTTSGPNGRQSSFSTSLHKTSNGYDRTATRTGPNGNSATSSANVSVAPNN